MLSSVPAIHRRLMLRVRILCGISWLATEQLEAAVGGAKLSQLTRSDSQ